MRPDGLLALMSARQQTHGGTQHSFVMDLPVPAYLIAHRHWPICGLTEVGPRTNIYAEPPVLAAAAHEFEDTEKLIADGGIAFMARIAGAATIC